VSGKIVGNSRRKKTTARVGGEGPPRRAPASPQNS
jgi:hypothetical protein